MLPEKEIERIIRYVRENYKRILSTPPERVAEEIVSGIREYGSLARAYLRMNWSILKHYILKPRNALEELRKRDPELYRILARHPGWLNRFFKKLYIELKRFLENG